MAYPAYVRERARHLRVSKKLSLDEIARRLVLPKTTVYYWIKDLPLETERRRSAGQRRGNQGMRKSYRLKREAAYARGLTEYDELVKCPPSATSWFFTLLRDTSETAIGSRLPTPMPAS